MTLSDDDEDEQTPHGSPRNSDVESIPEDDEDSELDCHSVDDEIEAE